MNNIEIKKLIDITWTGERYCLTKKECDVTKYIGNHDGMFKRIIVLRNMGGMLRSSYA